MSDQCQTWPEGTIIEVEAMGVLQETFKDFVLALVLAITKIHTLKIKWQSE